MPERGGAGMRVPNYIAKAYYELIEIRKTWKRERDGVLTKENLRVSFIDGIVFGLSLAIDVANKYRRMAVPIKRRRRC